jgi:hypothetical protein
VYDAGTNSVIDTGVEGLPGGSFARGAPGNAGGGGTDADPAANDQNTGGGGGGNGGVGGQGGNSWSSNQPVGGFGGAVYPAAANLLVLGGGGGAGTRNNSDTIPNASSGGAGGGIVLVRARTVSGTGTVTANGVMGVTPQNDGGGGGGAAGSVEIVIGTGAVTGITVSAQGGQGTDANDAGVGTGERHGPGGGGGGGVILLSGSAAGTNVSGGANGMTTTTPTAYGATPGAPGTVAINVTFSQIPGADSGAEVTQTSLSSSPNPSVFGQNVSFTATVAPMVGPGVPTGTVTFKEGATVLGTGTLNASGVATFSTTLSVGTHNVTAVYGGSGSYTGSTSALDAQVVNQASTSTALSSAPNPSVFGQSVTFTATVTATAPGAGTPTGTVTFKEGAVVLGSGTLNASGVATFSTTTLSVGNALRHRPLRGQRQLHRQHLGPRRPGGQPGRHRHGAELRPQPFRLRPVGHLHGHGHGDGPGRGHAHGHGDVQGRGGRAGHGHAQRQRRRHLQHLHAVGRHP